MNRMDVRMINPGFMRYLIPWCIWRGGPENRTVYLTFDDGPHPEHTPDILKILKDSQAPGAFFLTGEKTVRHPGVVERIHREGHTIGNHGFSHKSLALKRRGAAMDEMTRTGEIIRKITGSSPRFFRPPYGRFDFRFRKWMRELDCRMVIWSLITGDFRDHDPDFLIGRVRDRIHPGAVILMHDGLPTTPNLVRALPGILELLGKQGYRFGSLDELD